MIKVIEKSTVVIPPQDIELPGCTTMRILEQEGGTVSPLLQMGRSRPSSYYMDIETLCAWGATFYELASILRKHGR